MQEMHQHIPTRNTTHHRKTTVSFRDLCLLDIFATSLEALRYLKGGSDTTVQKQVRKFVDQRGSIRVSCSWGYIIQLCHPGTRTCNTAVHASLHHTSQLAACKGCIIMCKRLT